MGFHYRNVQTRILYTSSSVKAFWLIKIVFYLSMSPITTEKVDKDWKNLMNQYSSICGRDAICDQSLIGTTTDRKSNVSCPSCSCDRMCRIHGNCCLDISFNTCVQTSFGSEGKQKFYFMKNDCLPSADKQLVRKCQEANENKNFLRRNPVTSKSTNMSYNNAYCAHCNNESIFVPWDIETNCSIGQNVFSTIDEVWKYFQSKHCSLSFIPSNEIRQKLEVPKVCDWNKHFIGECNATGKLSSFDSTVETACKTNYQPFGLFQNPFCLMCNIADDLFGPPISTCNVTGQIDYIPQDLYDACINDTVEALQYPYKNKYCKECNLVKTGRTDIKLQDATLSINIYNRPMTSNMHGQSIPGKLTYESEFRVSNVNFSFDSSISIRLYNINSFYQAYTEDFGWFLKRKWCRRARSHIDADAEYSDDKHSYLPCSCTSECNNTNNCCEDPKYNIIMKQVNKWSCVDVSYPPIPDFHQHSYFMISKCSKAYNNTEIKNLCENDNKHYLSLIPVTDKDTSVTYKNYFCFLCVVPDSNYIQNHTYLVPWTISLACPKIWNFKREASLELIIQNVDSRNCQLNFQPSLSFPPDCVFSVAGSLYCSLCDQARTTVGGRYELTNYRTIFSLFENTDEIDLEKPKDPNAKCQDNEFFDIFKGKCRQLFCFPGKTLVNGKCYPLISFRSPLIYNIAFKASLRVHQGYMQMNLDQVIQTMISFLIEDLHNGTDLSVNILEYRQRYRRMCEDTIMVLDSNPLELSIFIKIIIQSKNNVKDRNEIEQSLYNACTKTGSFQNFSLEFSEDVKAWFLPIQEKTLPFLQLCDTHYQSFRQYSNNPGIDITKLLFCPQLSLTNEECQISHDGLQVYVSSLNRTFFYNEFSRGENNTVRICASDYTPTKQSNQTQSGSGEHSEHFFLEVLTILTTCISIVSLVITFIVYSILKKLRTIPGQNLMCFVGSLFFAQLFLLFKGVFEDNKIACNVVGIFIYYFWLSTFTCASVCSLHMFRVFVCDARFYDKNLCNHTIILYSLYAFLVPVLCICLTIGIHMHLSQSSLTGFGGSSCFIDDKDTQLYSFILPISIICFINFILFSITFYKIHSAPTIENTQCRNDLRIYFKLFLLTGTAWVFQIIDGLFPVSPFSYLVTVINGSQGVYIMISFVFTHRVKLMFVELGWFDKLGLRNGKKSQSSGETKLTHRSAAPSELARIYQPCST
ncbi:uncharacterized protein LOC134261621 [Saccostrea cucullata]|uniref:uncharacterized protein LOC134261621 n=1 Tax=Saccostrea cuccullata TaxID=36930 RepID=UPI002ED21EA1